MTQYHSVHVKLSNSRLNKLKSAIKNATEVTDRQISKPCKVFAHNKVGLPLMKNILKPLTYSILIPFGLTAVGSAADAGICQKDYRFADENIYNFKRRN